MSQSNTRNVGQQLTLEQRRVFILLPVEQRRRQMAQQAEQMAEHYQSPEETAVREQWQGGEIVRKQ